MKKVISIVLLCSMILLCPVSVWATDLYAEDKTYNLDELFMEYRAKTLTEMVEFISVNPFVSGFLENLRNTFVECNYMFFIHTTGELTSGRVPNLEAVGISYDHSEKYLLSTARVVKPDESMYDILLGEIGNKVMTVELNVEFIEHINSLDRVEGNKLILDFLINIIGNKEVVGISWTRDNLIYGDNNSNSNQTAIVGDCDGDGSINSKDSFLIRLVIIGKGHDNIDPFAVDINGDGDINAKDSLALRRKIAVG